MNFGNPQDETMAKEQAKIRLKQQNNEQRRLRILNAKQRTIGLDVQALDAQVREKQDRLRNEQDRADLQQAQALEIERILAAAEEEEMQMKQFQSDELRRSWEESMKLKEAMKKEKVPDYEPEKFSTSSAQKFVGEDIHREERLKLQKLQMRRWAEERIAEKEYLKQLDLEDDMTYAELLRAVDEIREATEKEERDLRKFVQESFTKENNELAAYRRGLRLQEKKDAEGKMLPTSLDVFNEDKKSAMDEYGRIVRKDMFRGYTDEQKRKIFEDNQYMVRHKDLMKQKDNETDRMWMMQDAMAAKAMEQAEYEENMIRAKDKEAQLEYLRLQIEDANRRRQEWENARYGTVEAGFFDNFGTSAR